MNAVALSHIYKNYGGQSVVRDFSLSVAEGERCALIAPSGSGKTTLFRLIAGLETPDGGEIEISSEAAYMFQEPRLFPQFTALRNVAAVIDGKDAPARAEHYLKLVGMGGDLDKYPDELSGGMAQRVALARALAAERKILLLDEPFKGLDDESKRDLISALLPLLREKTLLLITHDRREADALGCTIVSFGQQEEK